MKPQYGMYGKMLSWGKYCEGCKYIDRTSVDTPCYECLNSPFISNTKRPFKWEEKE